MAKQSFGEYLKEVRISNNLSITKLAEVSGFSRPYLSQIESGHKKPTLEVLKRLADGLCYVTNEYYSYGTLLEKAGYEELAKGQMLLELQRQRLAEENLKGGDGMIRYEQITPRQAVEMVLGGRTNSLFVEIDNRLININFTDVRVKDVDEFDWFFRIEQNESK